MKKNKKTEEQKRWSAVIESVLEKINRTPWDNSTAPCGGIIKWRGDGALPTTLKSDYIDDMKDDIGKTGGPQETDAKKLAEMNQWDKDDLYLFEDAEMDGSSVDDLPDFENEDDDDVEAAKKDAEEKSDSDADSDDEDDVDDILDDLEGEDEDDEDDEKYKELKEDTDEHVDDTVDTDEELKDSDYDDDEDPKNTDGDSKSTKSSKNKEDGEFADSLDDGEDGGVDDSEAEAIAEAFLRTLKKRSARSILENDDLTFSRLLEEVENEEEFNGDDGVHTGGDEDEIDADDDYSDLEDDSDDTDGDDLGEEVLLSDEDDNSPEKHVNFDKLDNEADDVYDDDDESDEEDKDFHHPDLDDLDEE